jgi:hypothetical protein
MERLDKELSTLPPRLFAAEPTRDTALRLGGLGLDLLVKLVDLLQCGVFGVPCVSFGLGFGSG